MPEEDGLFNAAYYGDNKQVQILLQSGVHPDSDANENGATPLYVAAQNGHAETVSTLFFGGANLNQAKNDGWTPLMIAACNGHKEVVSTLIAIGAKINQANCNGTTPTFIAAQSGHTETVSTLIAAGADIHQAMNDGATPLFIASQKGHTQTVLTLIAGGANINQATNNGATPLHIAAYKGHKKVVAIMVENNANVFLCDKNNESALYNAAEMGHTDIVVILLQARADSTSKSKNGKTPLMIAREKGHDEAARLLECADANLYNCALYAREKEMLDVLQNRAHPDSATDENGGTPLYAAAQSGHTDILKILLSFSANINRACIDGATPLFIAAQNDRREVLSTLISSGADLDQAKSDGSTPLSVASQKGHKYIVSALVSAGANINQATNDGWTPLLYAAQYGYKDIVSTLIAAGADINQTVQDERLSPLHLAVKSGHRDIVWLLIAAGANRLLATEDGWTPLFYAAANGHTELIPMLILAGTNMNHTAVDGATALYIATENGHEAFVKFLIGENADVNIATQDGKTALYIAAEKGYYDIVSILLEAKADIDIQTNDGATPLWIASEKGHLKVSDVLREEIESRLREKDILFDAVKSEETSMRELKMLLSRAKNPNVVDEDGDSLLHLAIKNNQVAAAATILKYTSANSCNKYNETPLTLSIKSGNRYLAKMIFGVVNKPMIDIESSELEVDATQTLGSGGYGNVFKGKYKNEIVAVKIFRIANQNIAEDIKREIDSMQYCCSPYLLQLLGVCELNLNDPCLVLEYMDGGDLEVHLGRKKYNLPTTTNYTNLEIAWAIANGLADIHSNGCIHRDLKSSNVLLSTKNYIKLADFGLTRDEHLSMTKGVGTKAWMAPEVLNSDRYGSHADIYSFGVILTELDTLELPYTNTKFNMVHVATGKLRPTVNATCSGWHKRLVEKCLAQNPYERPSALDIVDELRNYVSGIASDEQQINAIQQENIATVEIIEINTEAMCSNSPSALLSVLSINCPKIDCHEPNSILNEFCRQCNHALLPNKAKVNVLLRRLADRNVTPIYHCHACHVENDIKSMNCTSCGEELPDVSKVVKLASQLEKHCAP